MGLTIHYNWHTPSTIRKREDVLGILESIRDYAVTLQQRGMFEAVSEIRFFAPGELQTLANKKATEHIGDDDDWYWAAIQSQEYLADTENIHVSYSVFAHDGWIFRTWPGQGCEEANFGLLRYAQTITTKDGRTLKTGMSGWRWGSFCKTQFANQYGVTNFLRCHLGVIALLDFVRKQTALKVEVSDEGDFDTKRDIRALVNEVGEWDEMVAGLAAVFAANFGADNVQTSFSPAPNTDPDVWGDLTYLPDSPAIEQIVAVHRESVKRMLAAPITDGRAAIRFLQLVEERLENDAQSEVNSLAPRILKIVHDEFDGKYLSQIPGESVDKLVSLLVEYQELIKE